MNPHQSPSAAFDDHPAIRTTRGRPARRTAAVGLLGCVGVVASLGWYTHLRRTTPLDLAVDGQIRPLAERTGPVLDLLVHAASPRPVLALCLSVTLVLVTTGRPRLGAVCTIGPTSALITSALLQELIGRPSATRLHNTDAYPSGHMTAAVALAAVCWVLAGALSAQHRTVARCLRTGSSLYAVAVGLALAGLRHHYITDVLGGSAVALAGFALACWLIRPAGRVSPARPARS